jgi:transmembrane sensor
MTNKNFYLLAQKYLDGKATDEEKEFLNEWYESFDDTEVHIHNTNQVIFEEQMLTKLQGQPYRQHTPGSALISHELFSCQPARRVSSFKRGG